MTSITIPNTFTPSTTISSSQMNANFAAVATALEGSLAIDGSETMTGAFLAAAGTAAAPGISFGADPDIGIYRHGTNELGFATAGTAAAYFDNAQKLFLLGAVDAAGAATLQDTLDVTGAATFADAATFDGLLTATATALLTSAASAPLNIRRTADDTSADDVINFERGDGSGTDAAILAVGDGSNGISALQFSVGGSIGFEVGAAHVTASGAISQGEDALTDAATISWDLDASPCARVTLGGNRTLGAPSNQRAGTTYVLRVIQDGTGSRTLAFNSAYAFQDAVDPVVSSGAGDITLLMFYSDGTTMYGSAIYDLG